MKSTLIKILALLAFTGVAQAATVTVTGTNPITNTDSSTIPSTGVGSLTTLRIEYGTCNGAAFGTKVGEISRTAAAPGASWSHTVNLNPGTSCVRAFVANTYGAESAPSNVATKVVDPPVPNPPQLTAAAPQAYNVRPDYQHFTFVKSTRYGTVKLGAACDEDRVTSDGFYAIERPRSQVTPRPQEGVVLVAKCA